MNEIEINEKQYSKLEKVSKQLGMPISEIIEIQVEKFLEALEQDPLEELEYLGYKTKIKKLF